MAHEIRIPQLGVSMEEGKLVEWVVADGTQVKVGDELYVLETFKATHSVEAPASGTLKIKGKVGETYPVGELLGTIE